MDLETLKQKTLPLCVQYNVHRLELFGSIRTGTAGQDSDIDFLVEFNEPENAASRRYFGLLFDLENAFKRPVDLLTTCSIRNSFFRQRVMSEKVTLYEQ